MFSTLPPQPDRPSSVPVQIGPDGFVSESVLDAWARRGWAARAGGALVLPGAGARLDVVDGVRILGRRDGESDPYGWTGRVFPLRELVRMGASVGPDGCRLGSATYDVEFGVVVSDAPGPPPRGPAPR